MSFELRMAQSLQDKLTVYSFRYNVLVEELGRMSAYADHHRRVVFDPLDETAHILMAFTDTKLVGTLRINFLREGGLSSLGTVLGLPADLVRQLPITSVTSRAAVLASQRGGTLFVRLAKSIYRYALENGIASDFIVSRPDLQDVYHRLGYRVAGSSTKHSEVGVVQPLHLDLLDKNHLGNVHSPFYAILQSLSNLMHQDSIPVGI